MIKVEAKYLEHDSGTKFYELVLFVDEELGRSMLVRRFGTIGQRTYGGQTKTTVFGSISAAFDEWRKLLREKESIRKDGRYEVKSFESGLYRLSESGKRHQADNVLYELGRHYSAQLSIATQFNEQFDAAYMTDEIVCEDSTPEVAPVIRDADWGSW